MSSDSDPSRQEPSRSSNIQLAASSSSSPSHETVEETEPATHVSSSPTPISDADVQRTQLPTPSDHFQAGTGQLSVLSPSHDIKKINLPSRFEIGESSHQVPRISQPKYQVDQIDQLPATQGSSPAVQILETVDENQTTGSTNESLSLPLPIPSVPPSTCPHDHVLVLRLPDDSIRLGMSTQIMRPPLPTLSSSAPAQPSSLAAPLTQAPSLRAPHSRLVGTLPATPSSSLPILPTPPPSIPRTASGHSYISIDESCTVCERDIGDGSEDVTELPCSHVFHNDCIELWSRNHDTCPRCGARLPTNLRDQNQGGRRSCCGLS